MTDLLIDIKSMSIHQGLRHAFWLAIYFIVDSNSHLCIVVSLEFFFFFISIPFLYGVLLNTNIFERIFLTHTYDLDSD